MINLPIKAYGNKSKYPFAVDDLYWFYENGIHTVDFHCYTKGHHEDFYVASSTGYLNTDGHFIYTGDIYYVAGAGDCVVCFDENEGFIFDAGDSDDQLQLDDRKIHDVLMENDLGGFKGSIYDRHLNSV